MAWCVEEKSDGRIPKNIPATLPASPRGKTLAGVVKELLSSGLWTEIGDDEWNVHDFLTYNPSAAQAAAMADARAASGKLGGKRSAESKQRAKQTLEQNGSNEPSKRLSKTEANLNPDPEPQRSEELQPKPVPEDPPEESGVVVVGKIPCPKDLKLTEDQRLTLVGSFIREDAIDTLTARFVANHTADPNDQRQLVHWRKCLAQAISGWWNNPRTRPKKSEPEAPAVENGGYGAAKEWA
jgi:hypothetical protein